MFSCLLFCQMIYLISFVIKTITSEPTTIGNLVCTEKIKIDHGFVEVDILSKTYRSQILKIYCNIGYDLKGSGRIFCVDGQWDRQYESKCVKRCQPPSFVLNSAMEISGDRDSRNTYGFNTHVTYKCADDYEPQPGQSVTRYCSNGLWNGTAITCYRKNIVMCNPPPVLNDGYWEKQKYSLGLFEVGQTVKYYCKRGYNLIGSQKKTCDSTGSWLPIGDFECVPRNFLDRSTTPSSGGLAMTVRATGYDMSPFIRRYAKYINEKALSYRLNAFDLCKMKRGKEEGSLRTLSTDKLLKTLPTLQNQMDALLSFDCTTNDLNNGVINMCFTLLFRDLIRLFASYNDAVINLLEKFFDMNKKNAREALDLYKKFLIRMDKVGEFLKVAESVGFSRGEIPDLTKAPSSLLDALEQHLSSMEGGSGGGGCVSGSVMSSSASQRSLKSGVSALSTTGNSFGMADDSFKQKALKDEEEMLSQFKSQSSSSTTAAVRNPFLFDEPLPQQQSSSSASVTASSSKVNDILDLFDHSSPATVAFAQPSNNFNDLLDLNNPFAAVSDPASSMATSLFDNNPRKGSGGTGAGTAAASIVGSNFAQPSATIASSSSNGSLKLITDDLETSLARLADNLTISPSKPRSGNNATGTAVQWNAPKGGSSSSAWNQSSFSSNSYQPMNQQGTQPLFQSELDSSKIPTTTTTTAASPFDPFQNS